MINYQFGQTLENFDWQSGSFHKKPVKKPSYQNGFPKSSLSLNVQAPTVAAPVAQERASTAEMPMPPKKKRPKLIVWVLLILMLIALGFGLYKLLA